MPTRKQTPQTDSSKLSKYISLVIFVAIVLLSVSLARGVIKARLAAETIEQAKIDNKKLEQEIADLRDDLGNAQSEEFIESQLRDGLGMAKRGEVVVVMPDEKYVRSLAPKMELNEQTEEKPNWQKWFDVFI